MADVVRLAASARRFLEEGRALADSDPVQASEKLYKAAEDALKAIAIALKLEVLGEVEREGRWRSGLYFRAARQASERLGMDVTGMWDAAWILHVEGFHEESLEAQDVRAMVYAIESLVKLAEALAGRAGASVRG